MSLIFVGDERATSDPNKACCSCQQNISTAAILLTQFSSLCFQEDVWWRDRRGGGGCLLIPLGPCGSSCGQCPINWPPHFGHTSTSSAVILFASSNGCWFHNKERVKKKIGKAIPVKGREGPWGCETSRLPHFLDNRLRDGGEVFSSRRRPPFTHFC
jgi:hypothetical protein